jgi:tellurite resistance protein TerC
MFKLAKRIVISIIGSTVILIGIIMIVAPGPAIIVIPAGLAILATEFAWARRWLQTIKENAEKGVNKLNLRSFFSRKANQNNPDSAEK